MSVMPTLRHLLCPVDFSHPSAQALRYAAALSAAMSGDLTILHVRAAASRPFGGNRSPEPTLEEFAASLIGTQPSIRLVERDGDPVPEILDAATALGSDVIIMGTHGRAGLERLLLGSVTERVVRRSPVPVLTVPRRQPPDAREPIILATVLCAVDFSEASRRAVEYAASVAASAGARLVLAHALEWSEEEERPSAAPGQSLPSSEEDAMARLNRLLSDDLRARSSPEFVIGYGTPAEEVLRLARELETDLVVLGIRRRNPIDLAVFGSTAQRLTREGACAVLTVRALE
jgi:nucleotide-binding universal stress UspA family protein